MKTRLSLLVIMALLFGCQMTYLNQGDLKDGAFNASTAEGSFFNGSSDTKAWQGGGIAFRQGDSALHIRGLWGQPNQYFQVDLLVNEMTPGTYPFGSDVAEGTLSKVIGQDAVESTYSASGNDAGNVTFIWAEDAEHLLGEFEFVGADQPTGFPIKGSFDIAVGEFGQAWTCDFDSDEISRCWFEQ